VESYTPEGEEPERKKILRWDAHVLGSKRTWSGDYGKKEESQEGNRSVRLEQERSELFSGKRSVRWIRSKKNHQKANLKGQKFMGKELWETTGRAALNQKRHRKPELLLTELRPSAILPARGVPVEEKAPENNVRPEERQPAALRNKKRHRKTAQGMGRQGEEVQPQDSLTSKNSHHRTAPTDPERKTQSGARNPYKAGRTGFRRT